MSKETDIAGSLSESSVALWQPESPFLDQPNIGKQKTEPMISKELESFESPFLSFYQSEGIGGAADPKNRAYLELLAELNDEEFDDAIQGLVGEASEFLDERFSSETEDPSVQVMRAENILEEYFAPLARTSQNYINNLLEAVERSDLNNMTDSEIDSFLDQFQMESTNLTPAFEYFFDKLKGKIGRFAKKAVKFAGKFTPLGLALKGLNKIAGPLLKRVLKMAINKLPASFQPVATKLAKNFQKEALEATDVYEFNEPTSQDVATIQHEFDTQLANLLLSNTEVDQEFWVAEYEKTIEEPVSYKLAELEQARKKFANKLSQVQNPEEVAELVENFIPVVLTAVKLGIKLIGRKKVVNFLAKRIATLIQRFVDQKNATLLSQAIVDTGLRLMGFEVTEAEQKNLAGQVIASTVEETVFRISALPESVFEDETLLECHLHEIFESAAAANFPPDFIKPELRETSESAGTWMMMPVKGIRKYYYKKFSKIFENVKITPQIAQQLRTFNGVPLSEFLKNMMGISPGKTVTARVHLYEAIPGTWLSKISKYEKNIYGLGSASKQAWCQLHPLTAEAAGILLGEPGLGRATSPKFLANHNLIGVGQRFYYLEITGAKVKMVPRGKGRGDIGHKRPSEINLDLDFLKNQIRIFIFISDTDAQNISTHINNNAPMHAWVGLICSIFKAALRRIFVEKNFYNVKLIHENTSLEERLNPIIGGTLIYFGKLFLDKLIEWIERYISEFFVMKSKEFVKCSDDPADGVTIIITIYNPPGFDLISNVLNGKFNPLNILIPSGIPRADIQIVPGHRK